MNVSKVYKTGVGVNKTLKWNEFNNFQMNWMTLMVHHTAFEHM